MDRTWLLLLGWWLVAAVGLLLAANHRPRHHRTAIKIEKREVETKDLKTAPSSSFVLPVSRFIFGFVHA